MSFLLPDPQGVLARATENSSLGCDAMEARMRMLTGCRAVALLCPFTLPCHVRRNAQDPLTFLPPKHMNTIGAGLMKIYKIVVLVGTVAATDLATDTTHMARRLEEQVLTASDSAVLATELTSSCQVCAAVIILSDGTYKHTKTFEINRDVTLRAQNQHGAILDGENARRVIVIAGSPTVVIEGLALTKGTAMVSASSLCLSKPPWEATPATVTFVLCIKSRLHRLYAWHCP